ncbi:MarR family winged helix-turn-helix transcriptional regulator [Amantichitinum ursilacus]|uniref:Organic hydroperoxide resistance transcriptional regulator n=1 Tax=Amantichitinum ursilacus TaxID=857265 RepID=A0A0N0XI97_9NEIS|nr:MarR family transcriptional regulator [Amantichitinum ursilacus]KPC52639.1 Organic hydroperoxide resistance transcriptional regulator [Amantichitinum ursilacus]
MTQPNPADPLSLEQQLCFPLYAASNMLTRLYRPLLDELGLTYPQYLVLMALWQNAPQSVGELGRLLHLDSGTLTPLLKRMQQNDLVTRERDPDDERRVVINLTARAREMKTQAASIPARLICAFPMPADDIVTLRAQLQDFVQVLAQADPRQRDHSNENGC